MEGCNAFIADCAVISCCCQCLILQLLVFLLRELPRRMAQKTREYAMKKLRQRGRRKGKPGEADLHQAQAQEGGKPSGLDVGGSKRILELEGIEMNRAHGRGQCMEEVEKVLEQLSMKGEFAFGSFWGRNSLEKARIKSCSQSVISKEDLENGYGCHVVNFQLIEGVEPG